MGLSEANAALRVPATFQLRMWNIADWRALLILQSQTLQRPFSHDGDPAPYMPCAITCLGAKLVK